jgi:hypothetical protein
MNEMLYYHIQSLENPTVKFGDHPIYNAINLRDLTHDIRNFPTIYDWLKNKNAPDHLRKNIVKALLSTEPPEEVKLELMAFLL